MRVAAAFSENSMFANFMFAGAKTFFYLASCTLFSIVTFVDSTLSPSRTMQLVNVLFLYSTHDLVYTGDVRFDAVKSFEAAHGKLSGESFAETPLGFRFCWHRKQ